MKHTQSTHSCLPAANISTLAASFSNSGELEAAAMNGSAEWTILAPNDAAFEAVLLKPCC